MPTSSDQESTSSNNKRVTVALVDFDGCSCCKRSQVIDDHPQTAITKKNRGLIEFLKKQKQQSGRFLVAVGSNRQDERLDRANIQHKLTWQAPWSVFPAIREIATHCGAELNQLLLPDIRHSLPIGMTYSEAEKKVNRETWAYEDNETSPSGNCGYYDKNKVMLLYAHIHHAAQQNPNKHITVQLIDDQCDILFDLNKYLTENRGNCLIPLKVTVELYHYSSSTTNIEPSLQYTIKGCGSHIDETFPNTIRYIANQMPGVLSDAPNESNNDVSSNFALKKELINNINNTKNKIPSVNPQPNKTSQLNYPNNIPRSLWEEFTAAFNGLQYKIRSDLALRKQSDLNVDTSSRASEILDCLNSNIIILYEQNNINFDKLMQEFKTVSEKNSEELKKLRPDLGGLKSMKYYINKYCCCGLFKFESDTHKKIKAIQKALDAIQENEHKKASSNNSPSAS